VGHGAVAARASEGDGVKFRCLIEPQFIDVVAANAYDAQLLAFAKMVRDLSPSDFVAWETGPTDEWRKEPA
jgi:hypothetical protein